MCGRYTLTLDADAVKEGLNLVQMPADWSPRFNVAPTQPVAVVTSAEERQARMMRWGLIPSWAKDMEIGSRLINARSETLSEKPSFRNAFAKRRCLVLADGFYEWKKGAAAGGRSQPYYFKLADGEPFAFAGLWEFWQSPEGAEIHSCTIITTEANPTVQAVHVRMPVILSGDDLWHWLEPAAPQQLEQLLKPYTAGRMVSYPVSTLVNAPGVDAPELVQPIVM